QSPTGRGRDLRFHQLLLRADVLLLHALYLHEHVLHVRRAFAFGKHRLLRSWDSTGSTLSRRSLVKWSSVRRAHPNSDGTPDGVTGSPLLRSHPVGEQLLRLIHGDSAAGRRRGPLIGTEGLLLHPTF